MKIFSFLTLIFILNAIVISSFHNHIHHSILEECLILHYQNNPPKIEGFSLKIEKPRVLYIVSISMKTKKHETYSLIFPNIRSPPNF
ncbi:MAG: hypothetical protein N2504_00400 [candidate division WOR-3 bacterium]|nr:hypothetical protein [candidate division WOR-3 bacterium]MCX7947035.1 hypothetical protein [candidate division WOR-3 bacterium]MDW8149924.1 hypothetical protein [candidate division WOR-3 bacterium]